MKPAGSRTCPRKGFKGFGFGGAAASKPAKKPQAKAGAAQAQKQAEKLMEDDPTVFQYDEILDDIKEDLRCHKLGPCPREEELGVESAADKIRADALQQKKRVGLHVPEGAGAVKTGTKRSAKYVEKVKIATDRRRVEQQIVEDRLLKKEKEARKDSEVFVTEAFKEELGLDELKRRKKFEEELEAQEERDQLNAAEKQEHGSGFASMCPRPRKEDLDEPKEEMTDVKDEEDEKIKQELAPLEKMFDLLNNRQSVPVPGASVRASSSRPDNETITYDSNGKWQPPQKWLGTKVLPGSSTGTAKEVILATPLDVVQVARQVENTRSASAHALNTRSSRSHCLMTLSLRQIDAKGQLHAGQVVFVDLAGSERVGKSGVVADGTNGARAFSLPGNVKVDLPGTRFDEARSVNASLSALGRVIAALARRDKYVSFRDSALTQMLKDPLSGHSSHITVMLALRSEKNHDHETLSTMRFGNVCRGAAGANGVRRKTANKVEQVDSKKALKALRANLANVEKELQRMAAEGGDRDRDGWRA
eukprot:g16365.t1